MSYMASAREVLTAFLLSYCSWQGWLSLHGLRRTVPFGRVKAYHKAWAYPNPSEVCRLLDIPPSSVRDFPNETRLPLKS